MKNIQRMWSLNRVSISQRQSTGVRNTRPEVGNGSGSEGPIKKMKRMAWEMKND
jgi:hypothetical protein